MNFIKKIIDGLSLTDDEEYDDEFEDDDVIEKEEAPAPKRNKGGFKPQPEFDDEAPAEEYEKPVRQPRKQNNKVVSMKSYSKTSGENMEVKVIRPKEYDDSKDISDTLKEGAPIILNLEGINPDLAQKILDFTSGAVYAMNGNLQKVTSYIFVITPADIQISGNFDDFIDMSNYR